MQRPLVITLILLLAAVLGASWWLLQGEAPPPAPVGSPAAHETTAPAVAKQPTGKVDETPAGTARQFVAASEPDVLDDPEIRAGLCGFKGRVVTHKKVPVGDCGVRMYRGAMDSILPKSVDLFAAEDQNDFAPQYIAGETRTVADGTWQITGVWPRAFYLMFAGLGTDAPVHQLITNSPSPGQIVDLGDIVLPDAGVIVGTVVDADGEPLAGALVRAADVPGTLAALFPVERFDPEGAVLVREPESPVRVVVMPRWAKAAFDNLPIPSVRTAADGAFRLVGVVPGSNMLATTANDYLSDVKPSVQVRAGQEKDVGTIRLKRGEELVGKVVDTAGKAIGDAEVLAGSMLTMGPIDLARRVGRTDAEGRFTATGFASGKVSVAARRGKGHAWVLAEPQSILGDVVVTLPATFAVDTTVTLADGKPATNARLQLLQGRAGQGAAEMYLMGISPPIDLRERKRDVAEGHWRIENLNAGTYTLLADAPGHGLAFAMFDVTDKDTSVTVALGTPSTFAVRVLTLDDKPIRNAVIYAESRGNQAMDMPVRCGRTGLEGKLAIDNLPGELLSVSAEHPRWGVVHGEVKLGEELVLRMQPPGILRGVLRENGKPPELGKYTVSLERRRGENETRGPIETVPQLLATSLDGTFEAKALQPGRYQVEVVKALDAIRSPGGIFAMAQEMFMTRDLPNQEAQVVSGQTTEVLLEAGEKPITGPTARMTGSLTVDGKLGAGHLVMAHVERQRFSARVDERGRFDFAALPVGNVHVSVLGSTDGFFMGPGNNLWAGNVKLTEAETRELVIEVQTSSIAGTCVGPDGNPVPGLFVQAQGQMKGSDDENGMWLHASTNAQGEFHFEKVAEGKWRLSAQGRRDGTSGMRGEHPAIDVAGGIPVTGVRLELRATIVVKGRVDLATVAASKPEWMWVGAVRVEEGTTDDARRDRGTQRWIGLDEDTGNFSSDDLSPGRWRLRLHTGFRERQGEEYELDTVVVPAAGLSDLVLRPGARVTH